MMKNEPKKIRRSRTSLSSRVSVAVVRAVVTAIKENPRRKNQEIGEQHQTSRTTVSIIRGLIRRPELLERVFKDELSLHGANQICITSTQTSGNPPLADAELSTAPKQPDLDAWVLLTRELLDRGFSLTDLATALFKHNV